MIECLLNGRLIRSPELKTGNSGKPYTNLLLSVSVGEAENIVISAIAFGDIAERLAKLGQGDAVSLAGSLKPTEWTDKTGATKHGLSMTVTQSLSVYDIQKRRKKPDDMGTSKPAGKQSQFVGRTQPSPANREKIDARPFDDEIPF